MHNGKGGADQMFSRKQEPKIDMHIWFVCDAGMGSSALGASLLQKKFAKYHIQTKIHNAGIKQVPDDVEIIVAHKNFANSIMQTFPGVTWYFIEEFMNDLEYERIVQTMLFKKEKTKKKDAILEKTNIMLNCKAQNSDDAIVQMGQLLLKSGYIKEGYIQGMLDRDHSLRVYIGNDIAIPHGEYEVKDEVIRTGIAVMIYPDGVAWGDEDRARIVIGIASKNDDHMTILANIADKLGDMDVVETVVRGDVDTIYQILVGDM